MAANKSVRTVRGPPNTPLLHACGPPCPSRRRQSPLTLLHGQVCIALYARRARVLLSILCSPGHVVEEDRIALPLGEATFVSQVLRIGHGENIACDEKLIQLAQAPFGLLDGQALNEAPREINRLQGRRRRRLLLRCAIWAYSLLLLSA